MLYSPLTWLRRFAEYCTSDRFLEAFLDDARTDASSAYADEERRFVGQSQFAAPLRPRGDGSARLAADRHDAHLHVRLPSTRTSPPVICPNAAQSSATSPARRSPDE